jgi:hypothetical protein
MSGTFGGIGRLEFAPSNAPDDPFPTWVDITQYVRAEQTALTITRGRQTELDSVQSSQLTCLLDNTDDRFTPGYTGGPYGANFVTGKKIRYSETIGERTFVLFTGYLEFPDIGHWQPIGYQEVQLTALDRLTRLGRTTPYISTLAAHIMFNGPANSLVNYWPLNDAAAPYLPAVGAVPITPVRDPAAYIPSATDGPPGDDIGQVLTINPSAYPLAYQNLHATVPLPLVVSSGQTVAVSLWLFQTPIDPTNPGGVGFVTTLLNSSTGAGMLIFTEQISPFAPQFYTSCGGPTAGTFAVAAAPGLLVNGQWRLVTMRMTLPSGLVELWCGTDAPVSSTITSPPATVTVDTYDIGQGYWGGIGHAQIYYGPSATTYPYSAHLAQYQMGYPGLEYQTPGQRTNTILDYAGVAPGDRVVDAGASYMTNVSLANKTAADALLEAVTTEVGRGFVSGDGKYVFQDRVHTYNI